MCEVSIKRNGVVIKSELITDSSALPELLMLMNSVRTIVIDWGIDPWTEILEFCESGTN